MNREQLDELILFHTGTLEEFEDDTRLFVRLEYLLREGFLNLQDVPTVDSSVWYKIMSFNYFWCEDVPTSLDDFVICLVASGHLNKCKQYVDERRIYLLNDDRWKSFALNVSQALISNNIMLDDMEKNYIRFTRRGFHYNRVVDEQTGVAITSKSKNNSLGLFQEKNKGSIYSIDIQSFYNFWISPKPACVGCYQGNCAFIERSPENEQVRVTFEKEESDGEEHLYTKTMTEDDLCCARTKSQETALWFLNHVTSTYVIPKDLRSKMLTLRDQLSNKNFSYESVLLELRRKKRRNYRRKMKRVKKKCQQRPPQERLEPTEDIPVEVESESEDVNVNVQPHSHNCVRRVTLQDVLRDDDSDDSGSERERDECAICLLELTQKHVTPCGHTYHSDCLTQWLTMCQAKQLEFVCPTCRSQLS
jgi:hypothetical protein